VRRLDDLVSLGEALGEQRRDLLEHAVRLLPSRTMIDNDDSGPHLN
jgi:hypothetical protein